ncbi:MAG: 16S rRNA (cytosine(1402)-N(4))-methyltransferase RsmH [Succiniclasticum sp.]|jgi:16S rRNA (cytosine1402-N4)-methyltransferase
MRRIHYKGKYPKHFNEKYKELQPDKYGAMAEHVTRKGNTPAGTHIPIMVKEILEHLRIQPGDKGFDATLGYGGHTRAMLDALHGQGHLCATDVDPIEIVKTEQRLRDAGYSEDILTIRHQNFAGIRRLAAEFGPFDFILADLGISSMQLDNPARGFTYKADGPLDLRMNPERGLSAAQLLRKLAQDQDELTSLLVENSDEPYAEAISRTICADLRRGMPIETTSALHAEIAKALSFLPRAEQKEAVKKSSARVFQALRIDVNGELEALYTFLDALPDALAPGGRVAVLTFHSGEDRLVKKAFKLFLQEGLFSDIARDVIRPTREECLRNPRAKPTKLRWAVRA